MQTESSRLAKTATNIINEGTATQPYTISPGMARDITPLFEQDNALSRWLNEMPFDRAERLARGEDRIGIKERAVVKPVYMPSRTASTSGSRASSPCTSPTELGSLRSLRRDDGPGHPRRVDWRSNSR